MCGGWLWQPGASFSQNTRGWRSWEGEASIALLWKSPAGTSRVLRDLRSQVTRSVALHVNAHCISLQKSQQRSSAHHSPLKDPVPQSSCYVFGFIVPIAEITVTRKLPLRKKSEFQNKAKKTSVCSVCGFFFFLSFLLFSSMSPFDFCLAEGKTVTGLSSDRIRSVGVSIWTHFTLQKQGQQESNLVRLQPRPRAEDL